MYELTILYPSTTRLHSNRLEHLDDRASDLLARLAQQLWHRLACRWTHALKSRSTAPSRGARAEGAEEEQEKWNLGPAICQWHADFRVPATGRRSSGCVARSTCTAGSRCGGPQALTEPARPSRTWSTTGARRSRTGIRGCSRFKKIRRAQRAARWIMRCAHETLSRTLRGQFPLARVLWKRARPRSCVLRSTRCRIGE